MVFFWFVVLIFFKTTNKIIKLNVRLFSTKAMDIIKAKEGGGGGVLEKEIRWILTNIQLDKLMSGSTIISKVYTLISKHK